ncbi:hypothetical protein PSAC2689_80211 [Paraburkholderia sacchari]
MEEVRRELAVRYLSNPRYPIGRVAMMLGYARPSTFTQWFTAQFSASPRAWRSTHLKQ